MIVFKYFIVGSDLKSNVIVIVSNENQIFMRNHLFFWEITDFCRNQSVFEPFTVHFFEQSTLCLLPNTVRLLQQKKNEKIK